MVVFMMYDGEMILEFKYYKEFFYRVIYVYKIDLFLLILRVCIIVDIVLMIMDMFWLGYEYFLLVNLFNIDLCFVKLEGFFFMYKVGNFDVFDKVDIGYIVE